jgi:site-specific recombinase XerD
MLLTLWAKKQRQAAHAHRGSPITAPGYKRGVRPPNYGKRYPVEPLTHGEIWRLLGACSRHGSAGIRNRALIVTLWRAGLRVGEALALFPKDVDLELGVIHILHGKGDRARSVGIDPPALALVERWLARRRELGIGPSRPLFCTITTGALGRPVQSSCVREMLKDLARKAGIERRVHPHALRHTHAAELARESVPVHVIRRQLGHLSLDTTARYVDHITPLEVIATMRARPWPTHGPEPSASLAATV